MGARVRHWQNNPTLANEMSIGEIGRIVTEGQFNGLIVLRHYSGWVSLDKPKIDWSYNMGELLVTLLPRGTIIEVTMGESLEVLLPRGITIEVIAG